MSASTIPTAPVSLSAIQSEFGGSNPISLSEYYRLTNSGGIVVPPFANSTGTYGTIPTSGEISLGQFRNASQGIAFPVYFALAQVGSDPYYGVDISSTTGGFVAPGVNIGAGISLLNVQSYQDEFNGSVGTLFYLNGNTTGSSATIFNHTNGRSRTLNTATSIIYNVASNYTFYGFNEGTGPGGVGVPQRWPNDGATTNSFLGSPTTWNMTGVVPPGIASGGSTFYTAYLRAF
jgi:hypothetical protein